MSNVIELRTPLTLAQNAELLLHDGERLTRWSKLWTVSTLDNYSNMNLWRPLIQGDLEYVLSWLEQRAKVEKNARRQ